VQDEAKRRRIDKCALQSNVAKDIKPQHNNRHRIKVEYVKTNLLHACMVIPTREIPTMEISNVNIPSLETSTLKIPNVEKIILPFYKKYRTKVSESFSFFSNTFENMYLFL